MTSRIPRACEALVQGFVVEPTDRMSRERFTAELLRMLVCYLRGN